jgi:hypothetical protein
MLHEAAKAEDASSAYGSDSTDSSYAAPAYGSDSTDSSYAAPATSTYAPVDPPTYAYSPVPVALCFQSCACPTPYAAPKPVDPYAPAAPTSYYKPATQYEDAYRTESKKEQKAGAKAAKQAANEEKMDKIKAAFKSMFGKKEKKQDYYVATPATGY